MQLRTDKESQTTKSNTCVAFSVFAVVSHANATNKLLFGFWATNMLLSTIKATYVFTVMNSILHQIKQRRLTLGLKQNDMMLRVGVSRQQYQRLESKGNPRLDTLELIAKGLNSELMLIPKEKLGAVMALLEQESSEPDKAYVSQAKKTAKEDAKISLSDDPWQDLLGDES
ncbi:helix-turn-helix transcriptional regulator [Marinospirillum alkaliphilum]|nr:helix-turn-helix transcriptional regulator [Marinospirillum alkaliphilum]